MMPNLTPTKVVDKNGILTTRNKLPERIASARISRAAPSLDASRQEIAQNLTEGFITVNSALKKPENAELLKKSVELMMSVPASLSVEEAAEATKVKANKLGYPSQVWVLNTVRKVKKYYTEYVPFEGVNYLEFDENDPSLTGADKSRVMLAKAIATHGSPMQPVRSQYGWKDEVFGAHNKEWSDNCQIVDIGPIIHDEWSEFTDTIAGNAEKVGMQASAQCACGWFRGTMRLEGTLDDILGSVTHTDSGIFEGETSDWIDYQERVRLNPRASY